jgi:hypothetical protein
MWPKVVGHVKLLAVMQQISATVRSALVRSPDEEGSGCRLNTQGQCDTHEGAPLSVVFLSRKLQLAVAPPLLSLVKEYGGTRK